MRVQPLESIRRVGWRRENPEKCEVVLPETWEAAFRLLRDELCDLQMPPPPFHRHKAYPEWNQGIRRDGGFHQEKSTLPKRHGETLILCVWVRERKREKQSWEREREWSCFLNRVAASSFSISGREEKKLGAFWCYIQMFLKFHAEQL